VSQGAYSDAFFAFSRALRRFSDKLALSAIDPANTCNSKDIGKTHAGVFSNACQALAASRHIATPICVPQCHAMTQATVTSLSRCLVKAAKAQALSRCMGLIRLWCSYHTTAVHPCVCWPRVHEPTLLKFQLHLAVPLCHLYVEELLAIHNSRCVQILRLGLGRLSTLQAMTYHGAIYS
jgi:hypothetical protein